MKNIHIIPTDKPSRLKQNKITKKISLVNKGIDLTSYTPINIYITSDEEIREGNWVFGGLDRIDIKKYGKYFAQDWKKIILTTDQDLIKNGVQAIDVDFLEWFVKNSSCEFIEIQAVYFHGSGYYNANQLSEKEKLLYSFTKDYKIIIPKEKHKYPIGGYAPGSYSCKCVTCKIKFMGDKRAVQCEPCAVVMTKEEPKQETVNMNKNTHYVNFSNSNADKITSASTTTIKQETLEEIKPKDIQRIISSTDAQTASIEIVKLFNKQQQERMYSEEEVLTILQEFKRYLSFGDEVSQAEWFEQFKKK